MLQKEKVVSFANIMGLNILDIVHTFTYVMIRRGPKIESWSTPQIVSRLNVSIGSIHINGFLFER